MPKGTVWLRSRSRFVRVRGASSGEDAISFTTPDPSAVSIEIRRYRIADSVESELLLEATTERSVNEVRHAALEALAERRIPAGVTAPEHLPPFEQNGTPSTAIVPNTVRDLFRETFSELGAVSRKTALLLRWRRGLDVPLIGLEYVANEFSIDHERWVLAPTELTIRIGTASVGIPLNDQLSAQLAEVVADERPVPTAHELLFEAQELAWSYGRSALVISLAALEVGIKDLVATLVPGSSWLVNNLPSPPVERIIRDYLPQLPVRAHLPGTSAITPSRELTDELRKAVLLRNDLVHIGRDRIDPAWLDEWLKLCESLLYAFECFGGRSWVSIQGCLWAAVLGRCRDGG
jgi:hypothetical protein